MSLARIKHKSVKLDRSLSNSREHFYQQPMRVDKRDAFQETHA